MVNRGIDRGRIYQDDRDRGHFLELLEAAGERYGAEVHGYVLMENHYHLILHVPEGNLSQTMQWLNVSYSIWYNRRHGRVGPLFQGRYKSVPVEGGGWLYQLSEYVHLNPVRVRWLGLDKRGRRLEGLGLKEAANAAEAAERLAVLREHRWSSYRCYAGYGPAPKWLKLGTILERAGGKSQKECQARYRKDLEEYVRGGYGEGWAARLRNGLAVGTDGFVRRVKDGVRRIKREWTGKRELSRRRSFAEVIRAVEKVKGEPWEKFVGRHGDWWRDLALRAARECTGMTHAELGAAAGGLDYAAVNTAVRRLEMRRVKERAIKSAFRQVMEMLIVQT